MGNRLSLKKIKQGSYDISQSDVTEDGISRSFPSLKRTFTLNRSKSTRDRRKHHIASKTENVTRATNELASSMIKLLLHRVSPHDNFSLSPIGIYSILALLKSGSELTTRQEIIEAVESTSNNAEDPQIPEIIGELMKSLESTKATLISNGNYRKLVKSVISVTNAIFVQTPIELFNSYKNEALSYNCKETFVVDFHEEPSKATDIINQFVSNGTAHKIPKLLDEPLQKISNALLASCIYFKGNWDKKFALDLTQNDYFDTESEIIVVKMMSYRKSKFIPYIDLPSERLKAVGLRFKGDDFAMYVVLPDADVQLSHFVSSLSRANLDLIANKSRLYYVDLRLPRTKLKCNLDLNEPLQSLGIRSAFTEEATFDNMTAQTPFCISKIIQAAEIEIDERGINATPTNAKLHKYNDQSARPTPVQVHVNRPFALFIHHRATNTILFLSVVRNPNTS